MATFSKWDPAPWFREQMYVAIQLGTEGEVTAYKEGVNLKPKLSKWQELLDDGPVPNTLYFPTGTPQEIVSKVGKWMNEIAATEDAAAFLARVGSFPLIEDGAGAGIFTIPSGGVGQVFAFDMYPNGAPAGNKFQSIQVKLP